ncbi:extracellular solute-binding protein [Occultella glacieicola]|uniref:Extracellular solute-binding protein n=1 Tax=Occultella glacieicola TaxID=2518684 RepID=A0ABY2E0P2_9MICO|nr:extracellular solute-binding protein [Occultella glacieicola]TDE88787.1 extracellular solute-binding protein [Occultella glacieicola]
MSEIRIARRQLLQSTLAIGGLATLGGLAGCSNEGRGDAGSQAENSSVTLPTYIPNPDFVADLPGENGVSDTMLAYPANPQPATDGPPGDGQDVSAFALTNNPVPPAMDQNAFWQELNERLGFTLSVSLVPSGDYTDRFQTTVAGDRLPDLFTFWPKGIPGLPSLLHERAADLTELLSGDAIEKYPFLASIPTESWRSSVYGGRIYGVPIARGAQSSTVLYGRYDLLEEQGIDPAAQSWDDLYAMFAELTSSTTWALANVPLQVIRQSFGIANGWSVDGGTWVSANEDERQLDALEAGRKLVADGLVHPDTTSSDNQQRQAWTIAGTTRFVEDTFSAWPAFANLSGDQSLDLDVILPPLAEGGGMAPIWLAGPTHNLTGISLKSADRAEALLDVLNYFAAPFGSAEHLFKSYGLEGVHHELVDGDPVLNDKGKSETQLGLRYLGEGPWVTYMPGRPDVAQTLFDVQTEAVPTAIPNPSATLFSETESRKGTQIGTALRDLEVDILQGRKPVSAWTDAVQTWKDGGGDAMRDEFAEAFAENGDA